ncbi:D-alanyl-D-alanine carboxypeptidase family protein [Salibacterium qingdaonense]|uniref:D-alanyl-D-alanine carboxypeptidase n=1 Tax=Salibacterium qingdaonense TaxID=266892 RepID=A0A1I4MVB9_9BACI|nr:D-alanyl-D-alanine carboxypeptidase family protein [Salibacterium qingdaonense]SFM06963.1 D-alanyl-D-alanine carboxypeptidase [Salibacterium qingdaonense]
MKQIRYTLFLAAIACVVFLLASDWKSAYAETKGEKRPDPSAETAVLMDAGTGQVLVDKKGTKRMYPASISKIGTAITALELGDPEEMVTVSRRAADTKGTSVYLVEGEEMPLKQLVQGLLINSGNDAGTAIAEHLEGTEEWFSKQMTDYLIEQTGIENTSFSNPHGLFEKDHYSTAEDMARITRYAMHNDAFRDIVSTKTLEWKGKGWETELRNHHQLLWEYEGTTGVKNGYVSEAGYTLVTSAKRQGRELIAVVMDADTSRNAYQDTRELLDYGFHAFERKTVPEGARFQSPDQSIYITSEEKSYLQEKGTNTTLKAGNDGEWKVLNDRNRVMLSGPLTKERVKSGGEKKQSAAVIPREESGIKGALWNMWNIGSSYTSTTARTLYYHLRLLL